MSESFSSVTHLPEELPDKLQEGIIYLEARTWQPRDQPYWARFLCPCGCGELTMISLQAGHHPCWSAMVDPKGRVTLSPSVARTVGCKAHYFIKEGNVIWAEPKPKR
jgi:hypothetical protein